MSAAELAEKGGEAFYQSLGGESDRVEETIDLLSEAVAKNPQDGTSHFRLGMIRLFRFSQGWLDYNNATSQQKEDIREAQASLHHLHHDPGGGRLHIDPRGETFAAESIEHVLPARGTLLEEEDRKSTRLNSSHRT